MLLFYKSIDSCLYPKTLSKSVLYLWKELSELALLFVPRSDHCTALCWPRLYADVANRLTTQHAALARTHPDTEELSIKSVCTHYISIIQSRYWGTQQVTQYSLWTDVHSYVQNNKIIQFSVFVSMETGNWGAYSRAMLCPPGPFNSCIGTMHEHMSKVGGCMLKYTVQWSVRSYFYG